MSRNGLTFTPGLFSTGAKTTNLYYLKGEDIITDEIDANIVNAREFNVVDSTGTDFVELYKDLNSGKGTIGGNSGINFAPNGSGFTGAEISMVSTSAVQATIRASDVNTETLFVRGTKPLVAITGVGGGSGAAMSVTNVGAMNYVTVTSSGVLNLQLAGGGILPGSVLEFVLNRASLGTVNWSVNSTTLFSFDPTTVSAGQAKRVLIFTPDGTNFVVLV